MILIVLPDLSTEDTLLAAARRGDKQAIAEIYDQYFPPIYNFIRLRVEDRNVAEDLASEVFVKLIAAVRGRTAPRHSLRGWLFRVARNLLYDHYGRAERFSAEALEEWIPAPYDDDPEIEFIRTVSMERAQSALRMLVTEQQEVLILRFGQQLNLQETADIMGKNVGAIKQLQFRAVNNLRQILRQAANEYE
jgi:RNA polymerase sigma-70 factor (ECF subfamily)